MNGTVGEQLQPSEAASTSEHPVAYLLPLADISGQDGSRAGAKAANLGELVQAGFPVPDGFVVTTEAFELFLRSNGLGPDSGPGAVALAPMPPALAQALASAIRPFGRAPLAVRSSGVAEDLPGASFAGQYETVLGVRGLAALEGAIRHCWASAFSARIAAYQANKGQSGQAGMAVLVQRLVPADAAGVAFTANPVTGDRAEVVVSAVRGLGERLVSGEASPDEWAVRDGTSVCRSTAEGAIDANQAQAIAEMARRAEAHFGSPQDVEWAIAGGRLFMLQARPITTLREPEVTPVPIPINPPPGFWERETTHFPEPISPMFRSAFLAAHIAALRQAFEETSMLAEGLDFREIGGYVYQRLVPLGGQDKPAPPAWLMPVLIRLVPQLRDRIRGMVRAVREDIVGTFIDRWYSEWKPGQEAQIAALGGVDLPHLSDPELARHLAAALRFLRQSYFIHALISSADFTVAELVFTCRDLLGWDDRQALDLLAGLSGTTSEPALRLSELAAMARERPAVRERIERAEPGAADRLAQVDPEFAAAFDAYQRQFSIRPLYFDLADPTLAELPDMALSLIRHQMSRGYDPQADATILERRRSAARYQARAALADCPAAEREHFERALARAERGYPIREEHEFYLSGAPAGLLRFAVLELGKRLAQRAQIAARDDVFFLEVEEAWAALTDGESRRAVVAHRRGERAWRLAHPGPASYGRNPGPPPSLASFPPEARLTTDGRHVRAGEATMIASTVLSVLGFQAVGADLEQAGGKGLNLSRLARAGLPVPPGFIVPAAAYAAFVEANGLSPRIRDALQAGPAAASATIRPAFESGRIPTEVAEPIRKAYAELCSQAGALELAVAVRSSATAEDLPEASFAGQQDTYLNVRGADAVLDAVRRCWGSLWTERAITYRQQQGLAPEAARLAAVVQQMIAAEVSGVMFTANPLTGERRETVVDATWGLGEALVGGLVTPDHWVLDKRTLKTHSEVIADKTVEILPTAGGVTQRPVPPGRRRQRTLSPALLRSVAELGYQIERLYGAPQDVEWCLAGGRLYVVQARPITTLPASPIVWDPGPGRWLHGGGSFEMLTEPISPLFATLVLPEYERTIVQALDGFGLRGAYSLPFFTVVNGHIYVHVDAHLRPWHVFGLIRDILVHMRSMADQAGELAAYRQAVERATAGEPQKLSAAECLSRMQALSQAGIRYWFHITEIVQPIYRTERRFVAAYTRRYRRPTDPEPEVLLRGQQVRPWEAECSLYRLAERARELDGVAAILLGPAARPLEQLAATRSGQMFLAEFREHLERYGRQAFSFDPVLPTLADDPRPALAELVAFLSGKESPVARPQRMAAERDQAIARIEARLGRRDRARFRTLLIAAQAAGRVREDAVFEVGLGWTPLHRFALELGRRLAGHGAIEVAEDVFWMEAGELETVRGGAAAVRAGAGHPAQPPVTRGGRRQLQSERAAGGPGQLLAEAGRPGSGAGTAGRVPGAPAPGRNPLGHRPGAVQSRGLGPGRREHPGGTGTIHGRARRAGPDGPRCAADAAGHCRTGRLRSRPGPDGTGPGTVGAGADPSGPAHRDSQPGRGSVG